MSFIHLNAFFLAALAIPIVIFYILKIRLRRVPVSTLIFWRQIFEEKKPRSLWQKLRHLVSLLLQLAFLALLVFALSEPLFKGQEKNARRLVLIVDNSASMNATDVAPNRLSKAKVEAKRVIDGLRFQDEMAIVAAGVEPQVYCGLTGHQRTLREALEAIPSTDGPTRVKESIDLARRLLADHPNRKIIVVSDGCFADAESLLKSDDLALLTVGGKASNVGITRFQARRSLQDAVGYEILAEVRNASIEPVECRLEIDLNNEPIDVVPLKLKPNETWSQAFEKTSVDGGRLVARINRLDALAADNVAQAVLPKRERRKVLLVTKGNLFLEKVFEALPLVDLQIAAEAPKSVPSGVITIDHRIVPKAFPRGHFVIIEPKDSTALWNVGKPISNPTATKQDKDSPIVAHVKFERLVFPGARKITFKGKVQVLASTVDDEPLVALIDRPEGKIVVLNVDLDKSELPLQTAFPILMTNVLAEFVGEKGELRESVATGSVVQVALPGAEDLNRDHARDRYELIAPDGRTKPIASSSAKAMIGPFDRCGIWTIKRIAESPGKVESPEDSTVEIACNLADRTESDLKPSDLIGSKGNAIAAGFGGRPIWYYLLGLAWLLAGTEWFLYQRRWID